MEAAKKNRTQQRRLFSKACNEFDAEEANLEISDKIIKLKVIEEKATLMVDSEESVKQFLFSENVNDDILEKEMDESESYIDRWRLLQFKLKQLSISEKEDGFSNCGVPQQNTLLRYPKIQLPTFNGDLRNWIRFWGQFEKVDKDHNLDPHDKFAYLSQCMEKGSVAEELIKSFPPGGNSYEKAIEQLKSRFGREELLIQVYVRDLLSLVLQKQNMPRKSLRNLYDLLETKLRALEILGVTRDKYASMLFPLVESALPEETLLAWERYRSTSRRSHDEEDQNTTKTTAKTDLDLILDFLQDEVQAEEHIILASQNFRVETKPNFKLFKEKKAGNNKHKYGDTHQIASAADLLTSSKEQRQCIFCHNFHNSADCLKVRKMTMKDREILVEKSGCCFLCLKPGHQVRKCYSKVTCLGCGKRHHILLCHNIKQRTFLPAEKETVELDNVPNEDQALANVSKGPSVMLLTLTVLIRGDGRKRKARAIIDSASQRSYILQNTAKEMKYKSESCEYLQHSLFGGESTGVCKHDVFTLYLTSCDGSYNCHFKVLSQPVICESVPPTTPAIHLKELSDYSIHVNNDYKGPIEILIGADVAGKIITGGYKSLPCGLTAMETRLGWTIMGRIPQVSPEENEISVANSMLSTTRTITELWTLDTLGILDPSEKKTKEELHESAREHFNNTVEVDKDNRFVVHLPWLENHSHLPDNFNLALKRLDSTARKLKNEKLYADYNQIIEEWAREGIIEEVPKHEIQLTSHYLPHRHVVKENSTTRIRPVFDASAKLRDSPSLNDCLEKGMNLVELIPTILTRFRMNKFGVTADIRKAFLQIRLQKNDKNYLRFLWYNENDELKYFRHCRVVFGISSSPFLLNSVIQYHLETILEEAQVGKSKYPMDIVQKLKNSFYVDNCLTSVKTETELHEFIRLATDIMSERRFDLRGWEHNCSHSSTEETSFVKNKIVPVLGLQWFLDSDTLSVNLIEICKDNGPVTKRTILAAAHKIFDPLGIVSPVTLFPKLLLQRLWKSKITWDEEVDSEIRSEFTKWANNLCHLQNLRIPRWLQICDKEQENLSLHFFCDASKLAYSVAAFVRVEAKDCVHVQLIRAKARITPCGKGETTIARLELLAATISARLASDVVKEFQTQNVYFWTDSTTVLTWIKREESWGVFVHNRVQEIRTLTSTEAWRHISGSLNPADLPSRGCTARHLCNSKWWEGPSWLYFSPREWPNSGFSVNEKEVLSEKKKEIVSSMVNIQNADNLIDNRFASYRKTIRMVGWMFRFLYNVSCKDNKRKGELTIEEYKRAEVAVLKLIQSEAFHENKLLKKMQTFIDPDGLLRLKTKLLESEDCEEFRNPILLPSNHTIISKLISDEHERSLHAGLSTLLARLREKFWILGIRKLAKQVISKCVVCRRHRAKPLEVPFAPLPKDRITPAHVFEVSGVDYAGPLYLKPTEKAWIVLFTCAVYRAVHFELVKSLTTEAFMQALRRFIARRGRISILYSDNGTNFIGTNNALKAIDWNKITIFSNTQQISWKFIPPTAAWWGGWWERMVRMLKELLRRVLGKSTVDYEELSTILCDCEAVINSRPLTYISNEPDDLMPLTPAMFIHGNSNSETPDLDTIDRTFLVKRSRYLQKLREDLRHRFRNEYLALLVHRGHRKNDKLQVGDVVLIGNDSTKRIDWPLGLVLEIYPGKDGVSRVAKLKTSRGERIRPFQRLYPLEISSRTDADVLKLYSNIKELSVQNATTTSETLKHPTITKSGRTIKIPHRLDL